MRIAQVNLQADYGGAERHVLSLARGLGGCGHEVCVVCHPKGRLRRDVDTVGLRTAPIATAGQLDKDYMTGMLAAQVAAALQESGEKVVWNLADLTSVHDLCALLRACDLLLTNDTGPMHVAAALGTPVIAVFGSTSPILTGPGLPGDSRHALLSASTPCAPCFRRNCPLSLGCMTGVEVPQAVEAALALFTRERQSLV